MAVKTSSGLGVYGCKTISFMVIIIAAYINNIFASECLAIDQGMPWGPTIAISLTILPM